MIGLRGCKHIIRQVRNFQALTHGMPAHADLSGGFADAPAKVGVAAAPSIAFARLSRQPGKRFLLPNPMQLGYPPRGLNRCEIAPGDVLPRIHPITAYLLESRLAEHHQHGRYCVHA